METGVRGLSSSAEGNKATKANSPIWRVLSQWMKKVGLPRLDLHPISSSAKNGFNDNLVFPLS